MMLRLDHCRVLVLRYCLAAAVQLLWLRIITEHNSMKNLTQTASNASMAVRMSFYKVKTVHNIHNGAYTRNTNYWMYNADESVPE